MVHLQWLHCQEQALWIHALKFLLCNGCLLFASSWRPGSNNAMDTLNDTQFEEHGNLFDQMFLVIKLCVHKYGIKYHVDG